MSAVQVHKRPARFEYVHDFVGRWKDGERLRQEKISQERGKKHTAKMRFHVFNQHGIS